MMIDGKREKDRNPNPSTKGATFDRTSFYIQDGNNEITNNHKLQAWHKIKDKIRESSM